MCVVTCEFGFLFFFSSRRRHTIFDCDWSSDVCSSDLKHFAAGFGKERSGGEAEDINHADDDGGSAVASEVRDECAGDQGSKKRDKSRCIEAEPDSGRAHPSWIDFRQPCWAPCVLTERKDTIDAAHEQEQCQIMGP